VEDNWADYTYNPKRIKGEIDRKQWKTYQKGTSPGTKVDPTLVAKMACPHPFVAKIQQFWCFQPL
jgi:hypothetical protein